MRQPMSRWRAGAATLVECLAGLLLLQLASCDDELPPSPPPDAGASSEPFAPTAPQLPTPSTPVLAGQGESFPPPDSGCKESPLIDLVDPLGEGFAPDGMVEGRLQPCVVPTYRGVASAGMHLRAELDADLASDAPRLLRFEAQRVWLGYPYPDGRDIGQEGRAALEWIAPQTGEYVLAVDSWGHAESGTYHLTVHCVENCHRGMTRFPIVLLHGMGGSDDFFDLFEYYYDVRDVMREAGFDVYATVVDPLAPSDRRARQLASQLSVIMEATGARKINLIGHSQGGVDGRALISTLGWGDRVASLTTIATPHRGTPLVDVIEGALPDDALTDGLVDAVGDIYGALLGRGNQELPAALRELGVESMAETFNPTHPDDPRVAYYSWTGHTCALTETACQNAWSGEVVDPFLAPAYRALQLLGEDASDGLVPVSSGQWGEFLGELPADHLDEVGMLFDDDNQVFDHRAFFIAEGDRLFGAGF